MATVIVGTIIPRELSELKQSLWEMLQCKLSKWHDSSNFNYNFLKCSFCVCSNMASAENLEKRAEELFKTLSAKDSENPKVFLDKKGRDIQNLAKELMKDIDDIVTNLEKYHKACSTAQTVGTFADVSGKGEVIGHSLEQVRITGH